MLQSLAYQVNKNTKDRIRLYTPTPPNIIIAQIKKYVKRFLKKFLSF